MPVSQSGARVRDLRPVCLLSPGAYANDHLCVGLVEPVCGPHEGRMGRT
jgi:hypothetical protein